MRDLPCSDLLIDARVGESHGCIGGAIRIGRVPHGAAMSSGRSGNKPLFVVVDGNTVEET